MIPAYIYELYLLFEVAVYEETWQGWAKFGSWFLVAYLTFLPQYEYGTYAMYYLRPNPRHADEVLIPSIFYFLKWLEHTPRIDYDEYSY